MTLARTRGQCDANASGSLSFHVLLTTTRGATRYSSGAKGSSITTTTNTNNTNNGNGHVCDGGASGPDRLLWLSEDLLFHAAEFLRAAEFCFLQEASRAMRRASAAAGSGRVRNPRPDRLWQRYFRQAFPRPIAPAYPDDQRLSFFDARLRRIEVELRHYSSCARLLDLIQRTANPEARPIGLLSELCSVDDPRLARAISIKRYQAMQAVVVDTMDTVWAFRQERQNSRAGPITFVPVDAVKQGWPAMQQLFGGATKASDLKPPRQDRLGEGAAGGPVAAAAVRAAAGPAATGAGAGEDDHASGFEAEGRSVGGSSDGKEQGKGDHDSEDGEDDAPLPPVVEGFLGFVVQKLRLRPEHEYLRDTVLTTVFKDLMIFDTRTRADAFARGLGHPNLAPWVMCLDELDAAEDPSRGWFSSGHFRPTAPNAPPVQQVIKDLTEQRRRTQHARAFAMYGV
eukprot:g1065.t1